jgi:hypothetical protein
MRTFMLPLAFVFFSAHSLSAEVTVTSSPTVSAFAKPALLGIRLSVRQAQKQGKAAPGVADCIQSLDESSFNGVFLEILPQNLNVTELRAADAFFGTNVGDKYVKHGVMQLYASVGMQPPEPVPTFSDAEYKELQAFSRTSAGEKLLLRKVLESPSARQAIGARAQDLVASCHGK